MATLCFPNPKSSNINSQHLSFPVWNPVQNPAGFSDLPRGRMENLALVGLDSPQQHKPHIPPRGADVCELVNIKSLNIADSTEKLIMNQMRLNA